MVEGRSDSFSHLSPFFSSFSLIFLSFSLREVSFSFHFISKSLRFRKVFYSIRIQRLYFLSMLKAPLVEDGKRREKRERDTIYLHFNPEVTTLSKLPFPTTLSLSLFRTFSSQNVLFHFPTFSFTFLRHLYLQTDLEVQSQTFSIAKNHEPFRGSFSSWLSSSKLWILFRILII